MKHLFLLLLACYCLGCKQDQRATTEAYAPATVSDPNALQLRLSLREYLTKTETDYLLELNERFTEGVRAQIPNRPVDYAYQQNLTRIRMQVFDEQTINHLFPFGDKELRLADLGDPLQLALFSAKCGFVSETAQKTFNYTCLGRHKGLFDYFKDNAGGSTIILNFLNDYMEHGTLTAEHKSAVILSNQNNLNFSLPSHRLFYGLFQLLVVEEMEAQKRMSSFSD